MCFFLTISSNFSFFKKIMKIYENVEIFPILYLPETLNDTQSMRDSVCAAPNLCFSRSRPGCPWGLSRERVPGDRPTIVSVPSSRPASLAALRSQPPVNQQSPVVPSLTLILKKYINTYIKMYVCIYIVIFYSYQVGIAEGFVVPSKTENYRAPSDFASERDLLTTTHRRTLTRNSTDQVACTALARTHRSHGNVLYVISYYIMFLLFFDSTKISYSLKNIYPYLYTHAYIYS